MAKLISPSELSDQLESSLHHLSQKLKALQNEDEILLSIEQDANLKVIREKAESKRQTDTGIPDLISLTEKDNEITTNIDLCNRLWILKGFLDQIHTDLTMNEFESIFYNLKKLDSKLKEFPSAYSDSVIIDKIQLKVLDFENQLDKNIYKLINDEFWHFSYSEPHSRLESITFSKNVQINDYSDLTYEELVDILTENHQNNKNFMGKKLAGYLNMNFKLDELLIQPLIKGVFNLDINDTEQDTITLETIYKEEKSINSHPASSIHSYIQSVTNCVIFINSIPNNKSLKKFILKPILNSLEEKILEQNIEIFMKDSELKQGATTLSQLLDSWFQDSNDSAGDSENVLKNWVNDSIKYWIDKKFKDSLVVVKEFKEKLLEDNKLFEGVEEVKEEPREDEDSWDWDEEDGEGEQKSQKTSNKDSSTGAGDVATDDVDADWDAWNDDDDLFDDEGDLIEDKEFVRISRIPHLCHEEIIKPFLQLSNQFKSLNINGVLVLRLKDLLSNLFIVLSDLYQDKHKICLFYNDFQNLLKLVNNSEISDNFYLQLNNYLELIMNEFKFKFIKIFDSTIENFEKFDDSSASLESEDDDQDQDIFLLELNDYIEDLNQIIDLNHSVNTKIMNLFIISNHSFILDFFIKKIFSLDIISQGASVKISSLQKNLISILNKTHNLKIASLKNFNKFEKISKILNDNLKTIELNFNDGEFFDFDTEELVQLIELLFVESDLRNSLVDYIREVRSEE